MIKVSDREMNNEILNQSATQLLLDEADNILQLLNNQETICLSCPIYEEIVDTKMYGFSEKINFAIELGVMDEDAGHQLLSQLEREISRVYEEISEKKSL